MIRGIFLHILIFDFFQYFIFFAGKKFLMALFMRRLMQKGKKTNYNVRNAGFGDAAHIAALLKQHPREVLPRAISDIVQNIDRFVVCEIDGKVVGTASWQILPEIGKAESPSVEIKSVAVDKAWQGKGIGELLIKSVIKRVKALNPAQIVVLTFSPDYFAKFGFKVVPKETLMHKLYMGCLNCTKYKSPFTCPEVAMAIVLKQNKQE